MALRRRRSAATCQGNGAISATLRRIWTSAATRTTGWQTTRQTTWSRAWRPLITHLVLFRPRADLSRVDSDRLIEAFRQATTGIAAVRRADIGRRVTLGRGYEQLMRADYPYAAILEFDDLTGLRAYLEHPAHEAIGKAVFAAADDVLIYDFEIGSVDDIAAAVTTPPAPH
jgi:hypothetical protein